MNHTFRFISFIFYICILVIVCDELPLLPGDHLSTVRIGRFHNVPSSHQEIDILSSHRKKMINYRHANAINNTTIGAMNRENMEKQRAELFKNHIKQRADIYFKKISSGSYADEEKITLKSSVNAYLTIEMKLLDMQEEIRKKFEVIRLIADVNSRKIELDKLRKDRESNFEKDRIIRQDMILKREEILKRLEEKTKNISI